MYKVITEVRLKDVLEHSALTDFNSSSADLRSWWWIRRVRGKKSIRLLSAWKTSSSSSSLARTRQKSQRECVANLDLSSALHTRCWSRDGDYLKMALLMNGTSSDKLYAIHGVRYSCLASGSNLIAVSICVSEPRSCLPSKRSNFDSKRALGGQGCCMDPAQAKVHE